MSLSHAAYVACLSSRGWLGLFALSSGKFEVFLGCRTSGTLAGIFLILRAQVAGSVLLIKELRLDLKMATPPGETTKPSADGEPTNILPKSTHYQAQDTSCSSSNPILGSSNVTTPNPTFPNLSEIQSRGVEHQHHTPSQPNLISRLQKLPTHLLKPYTQKLTSLLTYLLKLLYNLRLHKERSLLTTTIITTSTNHHFSIPTSLLTQNSAFFSTMLLHPSAPWIETQTRVVNLEEIVTEAFAVYVLWLEGGDVDGEGVLGVDCSAELESSSLGSILVSAGDGGNENSVGKGEEGEKGDKGLGKRMAKLELLVESYILGDYIQAPFGFMDRVMSCVIAALGEVYQGGYSPLSHGHGHQKSRSENKIPMEILRLIWEGTYPGTPLRDVVIDLLASLFSRGGVRRGMLVRGGLGEDMVREMMGKVRERREDNSREGVRARMPWETYHRRYFLYARAEKVREEKQKQKGEGEGEVETEIVPYWDVQGYELKLPDGAKW